MNADWLTYNGLTVTITMKPGIGRFADRVFENVTINTDASPDQADKVLQLKDTSGVFQGIKIHMDDVLSIT